MPDIPAFINSTAAFDGSKIFTSELEVPGDRDWIRFTLEAGETVGVTTLGYQIGLTDPQLAVFDRFGTFLIADSDDDPEGFATLRFTAERSDTYFVQVGSKAGFNTGEYRLRLSSIDTPNFAPDTVLRPIDYGTRVAGNTVSVYFAPEGEGPFGGLFGGTSNGFNNYEISRFEAAFDLLSTFADIKFEVTDDVLEADFSLYNDNMFLAENGFAGAFSPAGSLLAGSGFFNGDLWDSAPGGDLEQGGFGFFVILHELLHGLGFAHPFETSGHSYRLTDIPDIGRVVADSFDQTVFTALSYTIGWANGPETQQTFRDIFGHAMTPMGFDIALLQHKYGANTTTNAGNTVYTLSGATGPGEGWQAIWDVGGIDELSAGTDTGARIDLRPASLEIAVGSGGFLSYQHDVRGGFTIAHDVMIEVARGGAGEDRLIGNDGDNRLIGEAGADVMSGGLGYDFYSVDDLRDVVQDEVAFAEGGGIDTIRTFVDYTQPENIEILRLGNLTGTNNLNGTGNDAPGTIVGNAGDNSLTGRGGNDQLNGNGGDDVIIGNTGRDTLVGGEGADTFVYSSISESRVGIAERDVINGFDRGQDQIDLSAMDANLGAAGDAAFDFIGTARFSGEAGELRLQGLGGPNAVLVEADLRGDGVADFQIFVNLTTILSADDFLL